MIQWALIDKETGELLRDKYTGSLEIFGTRGQARLAAWSYASAYRPVKVRVEVCEWHTR
jgi:hypothetical protein